MMNSTQNNRICQMDSARPRATAINHASNQPITSDASTSLQAFSKSTTSNKVFQNFSFKSALINKNRYRTLISFVAIVLIVTTGISLSHIGLTVSYFADTERSVANTFKAGLLQFSVTSDSSLDAYVGKRSLGGQTLIPTLIPQDGSFPISYVISVEKVSGDDMFCLALQAEATSSPLYSGSLLSLVTGTSTVPGSWQLEVFLPEDTIGISSTSTCQIHLVYRGWVTDGLEQGGYSDTQKLLVTLHPLGISEFKPIDEIDTPPIPVTPTSTPPVRPPRSKTGDLPAVPLPVNTGGGTSSTSTDPEPPIMPPVTPPDDHASSTLDVPTPATSTDPLPGGGGDSTPPVPPEPPVMPPADPPPVTTPEPNPPVSSDTPPPPSNPQPPEPSVPPPAEPTPPPPVESQ